MYVIHWEFEVSPDRAAEFCSIYSPRGEWAQLFAQAPGYLGTELFRSAEHPDRFLTIDRWSQPEDFTSFKQLWDGPYSELDARCEGLTLSERKLGAFVEIDPL
jgi:quinol monooxygenase YgiN